MRNRTGVLSERVGSLATTSTLPAGEMLTGIEGAHPAAMRSRLAYTTSRGTMIQGMTERVLASQMAKKYRGKVQLILTSPPFPLNRKKKYGNLQGEEYIQWLAGFAPLFRKFLKPKGSLVIELGNAWEPGLPVMSTLGLRALLAVLEEGDFYLCQQFVAFNKARLPSPAQWVNVERIRVKDAYTHVWWMSKSARPRANNRRVLKEYTPSMKRLLRTRRYNSGRRPSEHSIGASSFLRNNGGAIPSNVLQVTNTASRDSYLDYCRDHDLPLQPSRMPAQIPEFFIKLLTASRDIVLDPFAGSNVTGAVADSLKRRWLSIEPVEAYVRGSIGRFQSVRRHGRWWRSPAESKGKTLPQNLR